MRILMVEYDKKFLNDLLVEVEKDYIVDVAGSGVEGAYLSQINDYDVMIVGHNLPDMDGSEVCRLTRTAEINTPILYISEGGEEKTKVECLDAGADVHLLKSMGKDSFKAQVRALARRKNLFNGGSILKIGNLRMNLKDKEVFIGKKILELRRKEFDLLEYLLLNAGRAVSKEEILEHVWQNGIYVFSNTVEVHIRNLRTKIEEYNIDPIKTVRGFGYKIEC
ncbi:response regulator transcription factor [Patescibacteria group bacterium]